MRLSMYVGVVNVVALCLVLPMSAPAATGDDSVEPVATGQATGAAGDAPNGGEQREDVLDRVFSPLDGAVTDINRDINEGSDKGAAGDARNAGEQREDVLDRVFSPLDKAVTDINRDINEDDSRQQPEPRE